LKKWCVLVHFGARLVEGISALHNRWWWASSLGRSDPGFGPTPGRAGRKNSKSDAKRCILMHGWRETLEIKRILKVEPVHECIIQASNTGRLMHRDAPGEESKSGAHTWCVRDKRSQGDQGSWKPSTEVTLGPLINICQSRWLEESVARFSQHFKFSRRVRI